MKSSLSVFLISFACTLLSVSADYIREVTHLDFVDLSAPIASDAVSLVEMEMGYENEEVYQSVQQGYGHLLSMWDVQGYRFFLEALKLEPDSVMANAGLVLCCLNNTNLVPQAQAALQHLDGLLEADKTPSLERSFGQAVWFLSQRDFVSWQQQLDAMTEDESAVGWELVALLHAIFSRNGYTEFGEPKLEQREAEKFLRRYCAQNSESPSGLVLYANIQVDHPRPQAILDSEVLASARKLVRLYPDFAPYHRLLGYCYLRVGSAALAAQSYQQAVALYENFLTMTGLPHRHCVERMECEIAAVTALSLAGNTAQALAVAAPLVQRAADPALVGAKAWSLLQWEGVTLPLRVALWSDDAALIQQEMTALQAYLDNTPEKQQNASHMLCAALLHYAEGCKRIEQEKLLEAPTDLQRLVFTAQDMVLRHEELALANTKRYFDRAQNCLRMLVMDLDARLLIAKGEVNAETSISLLSKMESSYSKQLYYHGFTPPFWITPGYNQLAQVHMGLEQYDKALDYLETSYRLLPNALPTLVQLNKLLLLMERYDAAKIVEAQLDRVQEQKAQ